MSVLKSTNPAKNYQAIGETEMSTSVDVEKAVKAAKEASKTWGNLGVEERVKLLRPVVSSLLEQKEELSKLITNEVGKPISESRAEVDDTIKDIEYFLEKGPVYLADEIFQEDKFRQDIIRREPWGVAAVITPWNWPLEMPEWGIIPNLVAGNTVVFKPSEESPLIGQKFADLIFKLNLPPGTFNIIQGDGKIGEELIKKDINLIWFTGSSKVGQQVFAEAGNKFIKSIMELGGSSPTIVFDDVNVNDNLINDIYAGRFCNCGQACSAIKRLFVQKNIFNEVVKKLVVKIGLLKVGDPMEEKTDVGSLVAKRQLDLLMGQVQDAVDKRAKIECGGKQPEDLMGAYYLPTILTNVNFEMRVLKEEVFGPLLPIIPFETEEEVIKMANNTEYGLSAEVYSQDIERARRVANQIQAGKVAINKARYGGLDCPFGGYKKSGMGREHGKWGFWELTQIKHIMIKK